MHSILNGFGRIWSIVVLRQTDSIVSSKSQADKQDLDIFRLQAPNGWMHFEF